MDNAQHPRLPLSPYHADPNQIPADTSTFTYDVTGNLLTADNAAALVRRNYAQNGALVTETQKIFPYAGARDSTQHVYTLRYRHDLDGRRVAMGLSPNLMPAGKDTVRYGFDAVTGALASVTDPYAGAFAFGYDAEGRPEREDRPGGIWEWRQYDLDGRMVKRGLNGPYTQRDSLVLDSLGRVREAWSASGQALATYNAFGALVDWDQRGRGTEYLRPRVDALGNTLREYRYAIGETQEHPAVTFKTHFYSTRTGRLQTSEVRAASADPQPSHTETSQYDDAGNRTWYSSSAYYGSDNGTLQERTASFYSADGRLRVVDRQRCMTAAPQGWSQAICTHWDSQASEDPGVFEEYRYDALGRRVLVRTRPERLDAGVAGCTVAKCPASITRTVWDGDQVVAELRADGESGGSGLENDLASGMHYGRVVYTHGPGIDAPLALTRFNYDGNGPVTAVPHANWRGLYEGGTFEDGTLVRGTLNLAVLPWSGVNTSAFFGEISPTEPDRWFGSLIAGMRDGSGQLYRRNRYLDPASGRFTQEDPIGLAGGMNLYGFGGGDPVTYSDPYGLYIDFAGNRQAGIRFWNTLHARATAARRSDDPAIREAGRQILAMMIRMQNDKSTRYFIDAHPFRAEEVREYGRGYEGTSRYSARADEVGWEVNVDSRGPDPVRTLAHELGGAESSRFGGEHDAPSVRLEDHYRLIRECPLRERHGRDWLAPCP